MGKLDPFKPTKADPWDARKAAHLLNRAGFGGTPEEVETLVQLGAEASVRDLVYYERLLDSAAPPEWVTHPPQLPETPLPAGRPEGQDAARQVFQMIRRQEVLMMEETRSWWLRRMVATPRPLQEKLALFWHGHFATQSQKVRLPQMMYSQNELFRRHAAGNFKTLALEVSRDPAMLRYLDNAASRKEHPNENYARELMELFTMGIGNYSEDDVKEAARAFTGWSIGMALPGGDMMMGPGPVRPGLGAGAALRRMVPPGAMVMSKPQFVFRRFAHDDGEKRFLGRKGNFNGEDIVNIIFEQPATAKFLCGKLYAFFVSDEPPPAGVIDSLAKTLREAHYELRPVLEKLFRSELFYSDAVIGSQIKSPVQLVVQALRQLKAEVEPPQALNQALRQMGQTLLDPPNVKGWDGGRAWITTATLLARYNFANFLLNGVPMGGGRGPGLGGGLGMLFAQGRRRVETKVDVKALVPPEARRTPEATVDALAHRLLAVPLSADQRADLIAALKPPAEDPEAQVKNVIHLMMSSPNYQLC